jgi:hypothetical protein
VEVSLKFTPIHPSTHGLRCIHGHPNKALYVHISWDDVRGADGLMTPVETTISFVGGPRECCLEIDTGGYESRRLVPPLAEVWAH